MIELPENFCLVATIYTSRSAKQASRRAWKVHLEKENLCWTSLSQPTQWYMFLLENKIKVSPWGNSIIHRRRISTGTSHNSEHNNIFDLMLDSLETATSWGFFSAVILAPLGVSSKVRIIVCMPALHFMVSLHYGRGRASSFHWRARQWVTAWSDIYHFCFKAAGRSAVSGLPEEAVCVVLTVWVPVIWLLVRGSQCPPQRSRAYENISSPLGRYQVTALNLRGCEGICKYFLCDRRFRLKSH